MGGIRETLIRVLVATFANFRSNVLAGVGIWGLTWGLGRADAKEGAETYDEKQRERPKNKTTGEHHTPAKADVEIHGIDQTRPLFAKNLCTRHARLARNGDTFGSHKPNRPRPTIPN